MQIWSALRRTGRQPGLRGGQSPSKAPAPHLTAFKRAFIFTGVLLETPMVAGRAPLFAAAEEMGAARLRSSVGSRGKGARRVMHGDRSVWKRLRAIVLGGWEKRAPALWGRAPPSSPARLPRQGTDAERPNVQPSCELDLALLCLAASRRPLKPPVQRESGCRRPTAGCSSVSRCKGCTCQFRREVTCISKISGRACVSRFFRIRACRRASNVLGLRAGAWPRARTGGAQEARGAGARCRSLCLGQICFRASACGGAHMGRYRARGG
jgi:hypothetical protein